MKTALIVLYVVVAALLILSLMQWMQIRTLNKFSASPKTDTNGNVDLSESSFGDMIEALRKNVKEVDLKF